MLQAEHTSTGSITLSPEKAAIFGKITPKQEEFVEAYLDASFIYQAANAAGCSERTARRWLTEPAVMAAIERMRQERREMLSHRMTVCFGYALDIVETDLSYAANPEEQAKDEHYPDMERVMKFIALMFKYAHDSREVDALKQRITELEMEAASQASVNAAAPRDNLLSLLTDDQFETFRSWIHEGREREQEQAVVEGTVTQFPMRKAK